MMARAVTLLLVMAWTSAVRADLFVKRYAYQKVMTHCMSEELYYGWMAQVEVATKTCLLQETTPILGNHNTKTAATGAQKPSQALYDAEYVGWMVRAAESRVSNFTCVMQSLGYLKEDLSLDFVLLEEELASLPSDLKVDFTKALRYCQEFTMCLPSDQLDSPIPINIQRAMAFLKCDKNTRMKICMKRDIKRILPAVDTFAIPGVTTADESEVADKLLHIMWGIDAKDDFQLY